MYLESELAKMSSGKLLTGLAIQQRHMLFLQNFTLSKVEVSSLFLQNIDADLRNRAELIISFLTEVLM
jgi:hypothetical protein